MGKHSSELEQSKGAIAWFMNNHVAANILMLVLIIGGIISATSMRTETFPSIDPKMVVVTVVYPGGTPYEIADSITSRVEEELIGIEGVKRIESNASEGAGTVTVELEDFANSDDAYNEIETAVNSLSDFPPENAERPIVTKVKVTPSVMQLAVHGNVDEKVIKYWAESIEDEIRQLDGVALTALSGIREYQISIEISESALQQYQLTLQDVRNAVANFSEDIPAGTIESKQGDVLLRIQERRYNGAGFESIVLRTLPDGSSLTIGDIGTVVDGFSDINLISRFQGEPSAFIEVKRSANDDTLTVANKVKEYVKTVTLPTGLTLSLQDDRTVVLKDRISLMVRNALLGFMLVFLILLLFLDLKLAFWTSAAIPISFFGGLMIMHFFGMSINMISLFALIVVLGVVVDDGIITGESIFDAQRKFPNDPLATLKGVKSVIAPVTVGVTTSMAAFAPLIFSTGTLGQIIGIIPMVVIPILFVSLLEAYFILPAHLSNPKEWSRGWLARIRDRFAIFLNHFIEDRVLPAASFCIRWRYITITTFICLMIITIAMVKSGTIRFVFFPNVESDRVTINVTMPIGTPFEQTTATMLKIENIVESVRKEINKTNDMDSFESIAMTIGQISGKSGGPHAGTGGDSASNVAQIIIQLVPSDFRQYSAPEIESMIRKQTDLLPHIDTIEYQSSLVGEEADIEIELSHPDDKALNEAAEILKKRMASIEGTKEVTDSFVEGKEEYVFKLTQEGLSLGLTPTDLGRQLRSAYFGVEAQRFQRGRSEVIAYVRYPKTERENLDMLGNMRIRLANGDEVPLSNVAIIQKQRGYSQIETVNGRRIVTVSGDADAEVTTPNDIIQILEEDILPELVGRFPGLLYSFEGESREQREDLASLGRNMLIALMLIYVLLGTQLRSYIQPVIIMCAIPFGVVGAIWGHYLLGMDLTFISLFGIVALSGVVVNDSVVLVDYFNSHHRDGKSLEDATLAAIKRRFRPILLTTLSTSLGLLPILLETSMQAQFLIPMVVSLATGIIFATVIILLLVPSILLVSHDVSALLKRIFT